MWLALGAEFRFAGDAGLVARHGCVRYSSSFLGDRLGLRICVVVVGFAFSGGSILRVCVTLLIRLVEKSDHGPPVSVSEDPACSVGVSGGLVDVVSLLAASVGGSVG